MPSSTEKQHKLMEAVAHGRHKPGGGGPTKAVAQEFVAADDKKKVQHKAMGGKIAPMNLHRVKLVKEDENHWHLHDGKSAFKVAKKGVSSKMHDMIVQHFADGTPDGPVAEPEGSIDPATGDYVNPAPSSEEQVVATMFPSGNSPEAAIKAQEPAPEPEVVSDAPVKGPAMSAGQSPGAAPQQETPPAQTPAAQVMPGLPSVGGVPGAQKELSGAYQQAEDAARAQGEVAQKEANDVAAAQVAIEQRRQSLQKQWEQTYSGWQARGDQLFQDIVSTKIDPNDYWNHKSTGSKISNAIGMALGGIGAGMTHGPNVAVELIQRSIDRDIDAQKANLGKMETTLGYHMQQGHTLMEAHQLAKADMLDAAAAQMQQVASKYQGQKGAILAQQQVAGLRSQAVQARQTVAAQGMHMAAEGLEIAEKRALFPLQYMQAQAGARGAMLQNSLLMGAMNGGAPQGQGGGKPVFKADGTPLMSTQNRTYLAMNEDAQKAATAGLLATRDQMEKLRAIEDFSQKNPIGNWKPAQKQRAASLLKDFELSWNKSQEGNNRLSDTDLGVIEDMMANPASFWASSSGKVKAALGVAHSAITRKQQAIKDAYLVPGMGAVDPKMSLVGEWGKKLVNVPEDVQVTR